MIKNVKSKQVLRALITRKKFTEKIINTHEEFHKILESALAQKKDKSPDQIFSEYSKVREEQIVKLSEEKDREIDKIIENMSHEEYEEYLDTEQYCDLHPELLNELELSRELELEKELK